ncbi:MAG: 4-(cytidine 5'-diphospho)-2-C-methyl-D-erythritol kinase [Candidatus Omnitrophica bacterium]|nr:4-(cytidine 5'-diphospho)-2-C-methyl-D-erythritol kinase [Candidatus Omnitrophota bacterium]
MASSLRVAAPAKLNLYLRVVGKRPDGYHELETIFEWIDLTDELVLEPRPSGIELTCSDPTLSCGEDNLIMKAARLLQRAAGSRPGAAVHLAKRIPIAAGLGGGSSDAATALLGLNALWELKLDHQTLVGLAAQLGADVPCFLYNAPYVVGTGRGDICRPIAAAPRLAHVLVVPDARLSTSEVFAGAQFSLTASKPSSSIVEHALRNGSLGELASGMWNDLEPEAIRRCPVIRTIQSALISQGCLASRLSGSGPAVFGVCRNTAHARRVARQLSEQAPASWRIETVQTAAEVRDGGHRRSGRTARAGRTDGRG